MKQKTQAIREEIEQRLAAGECATSKELIELKMEYLGKGGKISALSKGMRDVPAEERPEAGRLLGELRAWAEEQFDAREKELKRRELAAKVAGERIDVTMPAKFHAGGSVHPVTLVRRELEEIFSGMGFNIFEGPEIERDYYNFQALNIPADHPARDMQDTFYLGDNLLLRTQTSAAQIRTMESRRPPIRMICPGRVYRADEVDATHSPVFHQVEGLVVDKGITMCDLKGTLEQFAREIYGKDAKIKFRPSFFPFTEPSVEVDVSCPKCGGAGHTAAGDCSVCKGSGWIEILGAGMVHPRVLSGCGIDPQVYSGFAFGIGLDRLTITKYKISDIRLIFENDLRFLEQF